MRVIRSIGQMQLLSKKFACSGKTVGFVPTMGALHEGHLSLIRRCRRENDITIVSIFVNPAQFGPAEDLSKYPRRLRTDARLCKSAQVDILFYPKASRVYPSGYKTYVTVEGLSRILCGEFRPGHFRAVATIVTKLFNIVRPDTAYFGQKDAQQAIIIKRAVQDLNIPVNIMVAPIVREKDGLAMSSRNTYLSPGERKDAAILYQALTAAKDLINKGNSNASAVIRRIKDVINSKKSVRIQYISVVEPNELRPVREIKGRVLIAVAVYIGRTRLIDNLMARCPNS